MSFRLHTLRVRRSQRLPKKWRDYPLFAHSSSPPSSPLGDFGFAAAQKRAPNTVVLVPYAYLHRTDEGKICAKMTRF